MTYEEYAAICDAGEQAGMDNNGYGPHSQGAPMQARQPRNANPYAISTMEWQAWDQGWLASRHFCRFKRHYAN